MLDARATLHDAIVSAGMGVLGAMLEEERVRLCGPRYAHQPGRTAMRAGHTDGELAFGVAASAFVVRAFATSTAKK